MARVLALATLTILLVPTLASARSAPPSDDDDVEFLPDERPPPALVPFPESKPVVRIARHEEVDPPPPPPPPSPWRLEGGMGWRVGSQLVDGHSTGTVHALHLDAGMRDGRLLLAVEYQLSELQLADAAFTGASRATDTNPIYSGDGSGLMHRVGANAKYSFARAGESDGGFDLYAEGGLGVEHVQWDAGGALTRPDVSLGLGGTIYGWGAHRHGGLSVGLRVTLAKRGDVDGAASACGGPCDYATPPTGIDRSFMLDMTIMFGT